MSRAPAKTVQMACLTIGHYDYLLPSAKAMKVAELMQDAFECREHYDDGAYVYEVKANQPSVEFKLVRPGQVRMPHGETAAIPSKPRQLR